MQADLDGKAANGEKTSARELYPSDDITKTVQRFIGNNSAVSALYRSLGYSIYVERQAGLFVSRIEALIPSDSNERTPSDEREFNACLDALEELFHARNAPQPDGDKRAVSERISELRREANSRYIYPSTVQGLRTCIDAVCTTFLHDDLRSQRKQQLDEMLWTLTACRLDDALDSVYSKNVVYEQARSYIDAVWMHTPALTTRLLTDLFDTELGPLTREIADLTSPSVVTSYLRPPWGIVVPPLLSFVFFAGSCTAIYYLIAANYFLGAGLLGVYLCFHFWTRFRRTKMRLQGKMRLAELAAKLKLTHDEVATGNFDAHQIELRLQRFEAEGLYVHSLVYPLLRIASERIESVQY